jgi:cytochrome b pre-mRNA-processing protein 3
LLASLFRRRRASNEALALYAAAVAQARQEAFYSRLGVPDSIDGRFDLVALHVWLLLRRLKGEPEEKVGVERLAQDLVEVFFADMDVSLREIGAADIGVGRRVKRMIEAFHGRAAAYDSALAAGGDAVEVALARNLYGTVQASPAALAAVADYLRRAEAGLRSWPLDELQAGRASFPPAPQGTPETLP